MNDLTDIGPPSTMHPQTHPRPSCSSWRWRSRSQLKRYRRHLSTTKSLLLFSALVRVPPVALVIFGLRILADPPAEVGAALAYAVREALTNVLKHADPRCEVHLFAESTGERLEVVVRDRGPGFEPDEVVPGATDRLLALPTEYGNIFLRDGRPVVRRSTDIGGLERASRGRLLWEG